MKERPDNKNEKARDFVKRNWPMAILITGGVVAGAVWLTAKYLRHKKDREKSMEMNLRQVEAEAQTAGKDTTSVMLESGTFLGNVAGAEVKEATDELREHIDDPEHRQIFETLGNVAEIEAKSKDKSGGKQSPDSGS